MKYAHIMEQRQTRNTASLSTLCSVLGVGVSGYHAWVKRSRSAQETIGEESSVVKTATQEHALGRGVYGAKRLHTRLKKRGHELSLSSVKRLRRKLGLVHKPKRRWVCTTDSKHDLPIAPNLLEQQFNNCTAPGQVWVADITYIQTDEGWLYLAGVKDLYTKQLVGWAMAEHMRVSLVAQAMLMAVARCSPAAGLIAHSDRGSQYASVDYRQLLAQHGMRQSMSRRGNCYDNAPMESFWASLKKEWVHAKHYATHVQAKADIFDYIETFYNTTREHSALGMSPMDFERHYRKNLSLKNKPTPTQSGSEPKQGESLPPAPPSSFKKIHEEKPIRVAQLH